MKSVHSGSYICILFSVHRSNTHANIASGTFPVNCFEFCYSFAATWFGLCNSYITAWDIFGKDIHNVLWSGRGS